MQLSHKAIFHVLLATVTYILEMKTKVLCVAEFHQAILSRKMEEVKCYMKFCRGLAW